MRYDWRNNSVLFIHNLDSKPREVSFATGLRMYRRSRDDGRHHLLLEAYGYRWYRVGGLDYLLKRSEIDEQPEFGSRRRAAPR